MYIFYQIIKLKNKLRKLKYFLTFLLFFQLFILEHIINFFIIIFSANY